MEVRTFGWHQSLPFFSLWPLGYLIVWAGRLTTRSMLSVVPNKRMTRPRISNQRVEMLESEAIDLSLPFVEKVQGMSVRESWWDEVKVKTFENEEVKVWSLLGKCITTRTCLSEILLYIDYIRIYNTPVKSVLLFQFLDKKLES